MLTPLTSAVATDDEPQFELDPAYLSCSFLTNENFQELVRNNGRITTPDYIYTLELGGGRYASAGQRLRESENPRPDQTLTQWLNNRTLSEARDDLYGLMSMNSAPCILVFEDGSQDTVRINRDPNTIIAPDLKLHPQTGNIPPAA